MAFFALLFFLAAVEIILPYIHIRRLMQALSAAGLIASAYFVFVQVYIIDALCLYCLISAGVSLLVFIFSYFLEPLGGSGEAEAHEAMAMGAPRQRSTLVLPPPTE